MKKISSLIKNSDIYGAEFQISVQNEKSIKTVLGGLLTILTFGFFLFTFIVFGYDFYYKQNPNVISQEKLYTEEEIYAMNNQTIYEVSVVLKMSKQLSTETYFIIDANEPYTFQKKKLYNYVKHCSEEYVIENFYPDNPELGKKDLKEEWGFLCYDLKDYKFGLHDTAGGQGSNEVNVLSIWTTSCKTNGKLYKGLSMPCPDDYDATKPVKRQDLEVWTKKILFNPDNSTNPFDSTWTRVSRMKLTLNTAIEMYVYLLETISMDDTGFILESLEKNSHYGLGNMEIINYILDKPMTSFDFTLYIGYDKVYKQYLRRYMKIQDLLAVVGGILKALVTFFQVITTPYNEHHLVDYIKSKVEKTKEFKMKQSFSSEINIEKTLNYDKFKGNDSKSEHSKQELKNNMR
jgi:hypothetical protein